MAIVSIIEIKFVERRSLFTRLNLGAKNITLLVYSITTAIVLLYTRNNYRVASLIITGSFILPVFEEMYFRACILGSVAFDWPKVSEMRREDRSSRLKIGLTYLILSSLGFALVHDDIIHALLGSISSVTAILFLLRFLFSFAIGGLYFYTRSYIYTTIFHLFYNLSYIVLNG
jgi:membrane protease YdiL (CAAX protease family)